MKPAEPVATHVFSCVIDRPALYQQQAQYLVASLLRLANVPAAQVIVHAVDDPDPGFAAWLARHGVALRRVQRHPHAYCNKLQQLEQLTGCGASHVVLMDCDLFVTRAAAWPAPRHVAAKTVDSARPPARILATLLAQAGLGGRWVDSDVLPGPEGRQTLANNCNGGVYVIATEFLARLAPAWHRWAQWCLARVALFEEHAIHVDQVSFALALAELGVDADPLPREFNFPAHVPLAAGFDCAPVALHYHRQFDPGLRLLAPGLSGVDAAVALANDCIERWRGDDLLPALHFGTLHQQKLAADDGGGARLRQQAAALLDGVAALSVLDVGCGATPLAAQLAVPGRCTGIDAAREAIDAARAAHPTLDLRVGDVLAAPLPMADVVTCLGVLENQPSAAAFDALLRRLAQLAGERLIVSGFDDAPAFGNGGACFHQPLSAALAALGFDEVMVIGGDADRVLVQARRRSAAAHARDITPAAVNLMAHLVDDPLLFARLLDCARTRVGFYPAHNPRALEYPWIASRLGDVAGRAVLDVGAGVNPLPLWLSAQGADVTTIDSHPLVRDPRDRAGWNEWGFLDYAQLDSAIRSVHLPYEAWRPAKPLAAIYSVSVIEHLPAEVRRRWIAAFARQLEPRGRLLLTVDIVPWSDRLWPFAEGRLVEDAATHGSIGDLLAELEQAGFRVLDGVVRRSVPHSRVGVVMIDAERAG